MWHILLLCYIIVWYVLWDTMPSRTHQMVSVMSPTGHCCGDNALLSETRKRNIFLFPYLAHIGPILKTEDDETSHSYVYPGACRKCSLFSTSYNELISPICQQCDAYTSQTHMPGQHPSPTIPHSWTLHLALVYIWYQMNDIIFKSKI